MTDFHRECHSLPKATRRRERAQTIHRCPCGDVFVVERYDLDSQGNSALRWKRVDIREQRC